MSLPLILAYIWNGFVISLSFFYFYFVRLISEFMLIGQYTMFLFLTPHHDPWDKRIEASDNEMSVGGRLQYNLTIGSFLKFVDGAYDKLKLIQEYEMKSCSTSLWSRSNVNAMNCKDVLE